MERMYCNEVQDVEPRSLQRRICYLLENFHKDTPQVKAVIGRIKKVFARGGVKLHDGRMFGLMTTAEALGVPLDEAISPSPDDTRIALVIGKPVPNDDAGICLERRYVVCMSVRPEGVFLSRVVPARRARFSSAIGHFNEDRQREAEAVRTDASCCDLLCDGVEAAAETIASSATRQVGELVEKATDAFEQLVAELKAALGEETAVVEFQRAHSVCRLDTVAIDKVAGGAMDVLGGALDGGALDGGTDALDAASHVPSDAKRSES